MLLLPLLLVDVDVATTYGRRMPPMKTLSAVMPDDGPNPLCPASATSSSIS
jgi:hypothetical protein